MLKTLKVICSLLGLRHLLLALKYSIQGLRDASLTSTAFRHEIVFGIINFICVILFVRTFVERVLLILLWCVLMALELVNSAIEVVVDMVSPQKCENARMAKDMASAAVFFVLLLIIVLWAIIIMRMP